MKKNNKLWIVTQGNDFFRDVYSILNNDYEVFLLPTYGDFKTRLKNNLLRKPDLFIFDIACAVKYFHEENGDAIAGFQAIILGDDSREMMRLFYSLGLTNYLLMNSTHNQLYVKIEFMLK